MSFDAIIPDATIPAVSVVIPAYNAAGTIDLCLQALEKQSVPAHTYEVIVVDDGSTDQTPALVRAHPNVRMYTQANAGPAAARNFGAKQARGEIILFTDADCAPEVRWIERMLLPFARPEVVGVKGAYISPQRALMARFVQLEYEDKYEHMQRQEYIDFIDTYAAGYRREVFLANGGFDTMFPTASVEDQEFSFRLARQGLKLVFQPQARVAHLKHASSIRAYCRKKFWIGYWKVLVHKRHPDKLIADSHTPQVLKLQILLVGFAGLALVLGMALPASRLLSAVSGAAFLLTTLPFAAKAWRKDRAVAMLAPFYLFLRACALGVGFFVGMVNHFIKSF